MSPIRFYRDAWNGAMHAPRHPPAGSADRSLHPATEPQPARLAAGTTPDPANVDHWLDGPGHR
jgi:hypothetical protein